MTLERHLIILMKPLTNLVAVLALSTGCLFADHHAEAKNTSAPEAPESRVEHLLSAANHLEAAGAVREAESIRNHVKAIQAATPAKPAEAAAPKKPVAVSKPVQAPKTCLLYTSPSSRDQRGSRMPSSA